MDSRHVRPVRFGRTRRPRGRGRASALDSRLRRTPFCPSVGQDDPDLLDGLDDVPVAAPALGQHHRVAGAAAPRAAVGVGQEEETWAQRVAASMHGIATCMHGLQPWVHRVAAYATWGNLMGRTLQDVEALGGRPVGLQAQTQRRPRSEAPQPTIRAAPWRGSKAALWGPGSA